MSVLNSRQIALLRDFRRHGFIAFFDSPFRLEGPELREMGMFAGIGDSTHISPAGMTALTEADQHLNSSIRGRGWRADCPKCVASKFCCDEHYQEPSA